MVQENVVYSIVLKFQSQIFFPADERAYLWKMGIKAPGDPFGRVLDSSTTQVDLAAAGGDLHSRSQLLQDTKCCR